MSILRLDFDKTWAKAVFFIFVFRSMSKDGFFYISKVVMKCKKCVEADVFMIWWKNETILPLAKVKWLSKHFESSISLGTLIWILIFQKRMPSTRGSMHIRILTTFLLQTTSNIPCECYCDDLLQYWAYSEAFGFDSQKAIHSKSIQ